MLYAAALCAFSQGDFVAAQEYEKERLSIARDLDDQHAVAVALNDLAIAAQECGELDEAGSLLQASVELAAEIGDEDTLLGASGNLGALALARGDYLRAREVFEELLAVTSRFGSTLTAVHLMNLGSALLGLGEMTSAAEVFCQGLALVDVAPQHASGCVDGLAAVAVGSEDAIRSARLSGAATAMRSQGGFEPQALERSMAERTERAGRTALATRHGSPSTPGERLCHSPRQWPTP